MDDVRPIAETKIGDEPWFSRKFGETRNPDAVLFSDGTEWHRSYEYLTYFLWADDIKVIDGFAFGDDLNKIRDMGLYNGNN